MNIESWATQLIMDVDDDVLVIQHPEPSIQDQDNETHLPATIAPSYYRSKAFAASTGINQLITAADPLLTLATQLQKISMPADLNSLQSHLCHEMRAFENRAQNSGYHVQIIVAARYALCALIDELILHCSWGKEWLNYKLVDYFHRDQENIEKDRFFIILERSRNDVATHIDLLELIYLCLRFGYEGEYRLIERGHLTLTHLVDNLYQDIRQQRCEFSKSLLISLGNISYHHPRKGIFRHLLPPIWTIAALLALSFTITVTSLHMQLKKISTPLDQLLTSFVEESQLAEMKK